MDPECPWRSGRRLWLQKERKWPWLRRMRDRCTWQFLSNESLMKPPTKRTLAFSFVEPGHFSAQFLVFILQLVHPFLQRYQRFPNFIFRETRNDMLPAIPIERLHANHKNS